MMKTTNSLIIIGTTLLLLACSVKTIPTTTTSAPQPPVAIATPKVELPDVPIYTDPTFSSLVKIDKSKPIDLTGDDVVKDKRNKVIYVVELSSKKWSNLDLPPMPEQLGDERRRLFIENIENEIKEEGIRLLKLVGVKNPLLTRFYFGGVSGFQIEELWNEITVKQVEKLRAMPEITDVYMERKNKWEQVEASAQGTDNFKDGVLLRLDNYGEEVTDYYVKLVGGTRNGTGKKCFVMDTGMTQSSIDVGVASMASVSFVTEYGDIAAADYNGHGTHVTGIVGSKENGTGIVGVAQNASMVGVKVLNKNGIGQVSYIVNALNYLYNMAKKGDVVNMSLAVRPSDIIDNAVKRLADRGVIVVVAAGNGGTSTSNFSPQRIVHPNVYVVGGVDLDNKVCSFSNYGDNVRYYEPAVSLLSQTRGNYTRMTGTSMAAPVLAGILVMGKGVRVISKSQVFIGGKMRDVVIGGHP